MEGIETGQVIFALVLLLAFGGFIAYRSKKAKDRKRSGSGSGIRDKDEFKQS